MKLEIKVAKASEIDIRSTEELLEFLEQVFYSDDVDDCPMVNDIAKEFGYYPSSITMEECAIVLMEAIRRKFKKCSGRWIKVTNTADIMVNQLCDRSVNYIKLDPYLKKLLDNSMMGE